MRLFIIILLFLAQMSVSAKLVTDDSKMSQGNPVQDELDAGRPTEKQLSINWRPVYHELDRVKLSINWTPVYQDMENRPLPSGIAVNTEVLKACAGQEFHDQAECSSEITDKIIVALIEDCGRNNKAFCSSKYGSDDFAEQVLKVIKEGIQFSSHYPDPWLIFGPLYNHSSEDHGNFELAIVPFDPADPDYPSPGDIPFENPYLSQLSPIVVVHEDSGEAADKGIPVAIIPFNPDEPVNYPIHPPRPPMRYSALPAPPVPYERPPVPEPGPDEVPGTL